MADSFVDASELDQLAADLAEVPRIAGPYIRSAVERTAKHIDDDWTASASGSEYLPAFPASITYDVEVFQGFGASVVRAEIGPDKSRAQGALGNLSEFGSVNNPPRGYGHAALQKYEDDFERGLAIATADAERAAGIDASPTLGALAVLRGSYR